MSSAAKRHLAVKELLTAVDAECADITWLCVFHAVKGFGRGNVDFAD
jgi:hypothetical protein